MVYLIDASVYVFRAWYSLPPGMRDDAGNPTHALYGFARFLADLLEKRRPEYAAVAFDESFGGGFRTRLYPAYKANRDPAPPELKRQFALCRQWCRLLGVSDFASSEYEADDLIGTLATRMRGEGLRVTIVSRDKDLSQLVGPGDCFWDYAGGGEFRYEELAGRFGVPPERMADYLALAGDSVDNIPGVPGVGPKTAAALMGRFATLDELYDNLAAAAEITVRGAAGLPARLQLHREAAFLARSLTRICCEAPLAVERGHLRRATPRLSEIGDFCARQGFGALLARQVERIAAQGAGEA